MAVKATVETQFGETRELYIRINNIEQVNNHGLPASARFRGYASKEAYLAGKPYMFERLVDFTVNPAVSLWPLSYAALKALPQFAGAVDA